MLGLCAGCRWKINDSVSIRDGERLSIGRTAINGSVFTGSGCEVRGMLRAVNGVVRVGRDSEVGSCQAVNGGIGLEENVRVHGHAKAVNGAVMSEMGCTIETYVHAVNGAVTLKGTQVGKDVVSWNGDITLEDGCRVAGDLIVKKTKGSGSRHHTLKVTLDNSVVSGNVECTDDRMKTILVLRGDSRVEGKIINMEVQQ